MDAADRAATEARVAQQPLAGLVVGVGGPHRARPVANATHVGGVIALIFQATYSDTITLPSAHS